MSKWNPDPRTGEFISILRRYKGLSREELCEEAMIKIEDLYEVENNITPPTLEFLFKVAEPLNINFCNLLVKAACNGKNYEISEDDLLEKLLYKPIFREIKPKIVKLGKKKPLSYEKRKYAPLSATECIEIIKMISILLNIEEEDHENT